MDQSKKFFVVRATGYGSYVKDQFFDIYITSDKFVSENDAFKHWCRENQKDFSLFYSEKVKKSDIGEIVKNLQSQVKTYALKIFRA